MRSSSPDFPSPLLQTDVKSRTRFEMSALESARLNLLHHSFCLYPFGQIHPFKGLQTLIDFSARVRTKIRRKHLSGNITQGKAQSDGKAIHRQLCNDSWSSAGVFVTDTLLISPFLHLVVRCGAKSIVIIETWLNNDTLRTVSSTTFEAEVRPLISQWYIKEAGVYKVHIANRCILFKPR